MSLLRNGLLTVVLILGLHIGPSQADTSTIPAIAARAWILVDPASGQALAAEKADEQVEPASLTKLMTAYMVFAALRDRGLTLPSVRAVITTAEMLHPHYRAGIEFPIVCQNQRHWRVELAESAHHPVLAHDFVVPLDPHDLEQFDRDFDLPAAVLALVGATQTMSSAKSAPDGRDDLLALAPERGPRRR